MYESERLIVRITTLFLIFISLLLHSCIGKNCKESDTTIGVIEEVTSGNVGSRTDRGAISEPYVPIIKFTYRYKVNGTSLQDKTRIEVKNHKNNYYAIYLEVGDSIEIEYCKNSPTISWIKKEKRNLA